MNTNPIQWETIDALINATAEDENLSFTWLDDLATHHLELVAYAVSEEIQAVYSELERVQFLYLLSVIWKALEGKLKPDPLDPETLEAMDEANWLTYEESEDEVKLLDDWIDECAEPELLELLIQGILEEEELEENSPEAIWGLFIQAKSCLDALLTLRLDQ